MAPSDPSAQRSKDDKLLALLGPMCVSLPWIILYFGGWRLYLYVLGGFALIMVFIYRRELPGRVRNWRAVSKSKELKKAA